MRVDDFVSGVIQKYSKQVNVESNRNKNLENKNGEISHEQAKVPQADKVEISSKAKMIAVLDNDTDKSERIKEVKSEMAKGTYKPPIDKISEALLEEWKNG